MDLVKGPPKLGPTGAVNTLGDVLVLFSILLHLIPKGFHSAQPIPVSDMMRSP